MRSNGKPDAFPGTSSILHPGSEPQSLDRLPDIRRADLAHFSSGHLPRAQAFCALSRKYRRGLKKAPRLASVAETAVFPPFFKVAVYVLVRFPAEAEILDLCLEMQDLHHLPRRVRFKINGRIDPAFKAGIRVYESFH